MRSEEQQSLPVGRKTKRNWRTEASKQTFPRDLTPSLDAKRAKSCVSTDDRIRFVEGLMRNLEYRRGVTCHELAKIWKVTDQTAMGFTSEASRRVRESVCDPEEVSRDVGVALQDALTICRRRGDYRNMILAAKTWAEIVGAMAPRQWQVQLEQELSPEQLEVRLSRLISAASHELRNGLREGRAPVPMDVPDAETVAPELQGETEPGGGGNGTEPPSASTATDLTGHF